MAVYSMYYAGIAERNYIRQPYGGFGSRGAKTVEGGEMFAKVLENTPHKFIFIITVDYWEQFRDWCAKHKLDQYQIFDMGKYVSNPTHGMGRRLRAVVFQGKGTDES